MIPVVVAPPGRPQRRRPSIQWLTRVVGLALVVAGVLGALVWVVAYSPVGFERVTLAEGPRTLRFDTPGEYLLYEERPDGQLPQLGTVAVSGPGGAPVALRPPAGVPEGAVARSLPLFEAWELGRFSVADPGEYTLVALRSGAGAPTPSATVAVAPVRMPSWPGTWWGLIVLGVAPAAVGVGVVAASGGRRSTGDGG